MRLDNLHINERTPPNISCFLNGKVIRIDFKLKLRFLNKNQLNFKFLLYSWFLFLKNYLRSPENFGLRTKRPQESSNESRTTQSPGTFDRTHQDSDETKKPSKTFQFPFDIRTVGQFQINQFKQASIKAWSHRTDLNQFRQTGNLWSLVMGARIMKNSVFLDRFTP